jgi:hypothetical protein
MFCNLNNLLCAEVDDKTYNIYTFPSSYHIVNKLHPPASVPPNGPREDSTLTRNVRHQALHTTLATFYHSLTALASPHTFPDCSHYLVKFSAQCSK